MKDPDYFIPDPREALHDYNSMTSFDDPAEVQRDVLETLNSGEVDTDTFIHVAMPVLGRVGLPIPAGVGIIAGSLRGDEFDEVDLRYLVSILLLTGSFQAYRGDFEEACKRFPALRGMVQ